MRNSIAIAILSCAGAAGAWTTDKTYWTRNPVFSVNTSNPAEARTLIGDGIRTIAGAGAKYYPKLGGTTGRDCAAGDSWFSDDDDGVNVIDWWDKCNDNSHWNINCYSSTTAGAFNVDLYNGTYENAEVDIVVCSNKTNWSFGRDFATDKRSYRRTVTHEIGHAMDLLHSPAPYNTTMKDGATNESTWGAQSLHWDDVGGLRSVSGACSAGDWTLVNNGGNGNSVSMSNAEGCGINLNLYTTGTSAGAWSTIPVAYRNPRLGGWVYKSPVAGDPSGTSSALLKWDEYDRNHSGVLTLITVGVDGVERELNYARNASNWWANAGWVNLGVASAFNAWSSNSRNIADDHLAEWGVRAAYVKEVQIRHFAYSGWTAGVNWGVSVKNLRIERD